MKLKDPFITFKIDGQAMVMATQIFRRYHHDLLVIQLHAFFTGYIHRLCSRERIADDNREYFRALEKVGYAQASLISAITSQSHGHDLSGVDLILAYSNGLNIKEETTRLCEVIGLEGFKVPANYFNTQICHQLTQFGYLTTLNETPN